MQSLPQSNPEAIRPCPQCGTGVRFRHDLTTDRKSCPQCGYVLPNKIAHFKLVQIIGIGGMGAVYRGIDTSLERQVAVKVMREEFARNPQFVESFLREARAAAALNHPNVAQIYSFGEQNSRYYLVMELLTGGSLDDRIEKEHRVPEVEILDVGMQVASGLRAAHERGLIHRDIKPGNILFSEDGTAKVVDFGLARFESKTSPSSQEEGIWGTPYYIAPEKVSDNLEDFRSDIYSLGGTLFHALAGRAPFEAGSSTEVVLKHLHSPSVSLLTFTPDCTPQTAEAIGRMLKRDPAERPQSYDEVLNDLAYAKRFALEKKPPQKVEAESEYSTAMLVGTLVMMVLCISAAGVLWFYRYNLFPELAPPPEPPLVAPTNPPSKKDVPTPSPSPSHIKSPPPQPPQPLPPPSPPPINYAQQLENAHDLAGRGDLAAAIRQFDDLAKSMTSNHPLYPWARLHAGRARLMAGRGADAANLLTGVAGSFGQNGSLPSSVEEKQYPQLLALILLGKVSDENFATLLPSMPDWMQMAMNLDAGLTHLQKDQLEEGIKYWQAYDQMRAPKEGRWILSYRNSVFSFNTEFEDFRRMERQVNAQQGHFVEIQDLLRTNQSRWKDPLIRARVAKVTEANRVALANKQREDEEKNRAEMARQMEAENKLMDDVRKKRQSLLSTFQFESLLESWTTLSPSIKTEANRKELQKWIDYSQGLVDFKMGLYKDIAAHPYDQNRVITRTNIRMSGELYATHDDKLVFRTVVRNELGSATMESSCKWTDLTPMSIYELGDFYIMRLVRSKEPNNSEVARRAILLAHFSRCLGLPEGKISQNLNLANRTGANMRDLYERLFPSVPPK